MNKTLKINIYGLIGTLIYLTTFFNPTTFNYNNLKYLLIVIIGYLFKKPFLVYSRQGQEQGMMSRIDTLLTKFNINRKFVDSGINNELLEANYENGYEILDRERKKAIEFLKEALAIE